MPSELEIIPVTLKQAAAFIAERHRHHGPPRGWRFGVGVIDRNGVLRGVATAGRPVARALDDGRSIEANRTCADGFPNANSMLYGAIWRAARGLGYLRAYTYTQQGESGASLRAAGWVPEEELAARGSWAEHSVQLRGIRCATGAGGVDRIRWRVGQPREQATTVTARCAAQMRQILTEIASGKHPTATGSQSAPSGGDA
ncbi:MAG TPA: XF1762 family protein [Actinoplanes sp.]